MSDLFDLLVQEEMNTDLQIWPVIHPIFPLFVPERQTRMALVVPTFSAETRTVDTSSIQRDEPETATHPQLSTLTDRFQPQVSSQGVKSAALTDSVIGSDDNQVRERNAIEESTVIVPTNVAAMRDHARLAESSVSQSETSASIRPDVEPRAKPLRAIQPQPADHMTDSNPTSIDTARPAQMRLNVSRPVVPSTAAAARAGEPPEWVTSPSVSQQPEIRISIGRIEVRVAEPPPADKTKQPKPNGPRLSLDDYLRSRSGGG